MVYSKNGAVYTIVVQKDQDGQVRRKEICMHLTFNIGKMIIYDDTLLPQTHKAVGQRLIIYCLLVTIYLQVIAIQHEDVEPNNVNILWQIPQYISMTLGEVFFSVTGLSFSYSQVTAMNIILALLTVEKYTDLSRRSINNFIRFTTSLCCSLDRSPPHR